MALIHIHRLPHHFTCTLQCHPCRLLVIAQSHCCWQPAQSPAHVAAACCGCAPPPPIPPPHSCTCYLGVGNLCLTKSPQLLCPWLRADAVCCHPRQRCPGVCCPACTCWLCSSLCQLHCPPHVCDHHLCGLRHYIGRPLSAATVSRHGSSSSSSNSSSSRSTIIRYHIINICREFLSVALWQFVVHASEHAVG